MTVTVEIPMTLPSVANGNKGGHWAARARRTKSQRDAVTLALYKARVFWDDIGLVRSPPLAGHATTVTLTRVSPRKLDSDNLAYAFKACRDSVAQYLCVDDADPRIEWRYAQAKGKACVRIAFEVVSARKVHIPPENHDLPR